MALDGTEVRLFGGGHLYVAPVGTTLPADVTTALAVGWKELGYVDPDGLEPAINVESKDWGAWQTADPVVSRITGRTFTIKFKLMQRNVDTIPVAFGGGTLVTASSLTTYTPPSGSDVFERAFVLETQDGTIIDRYRIQRATVSDIGSFPIKRDDVTVFDVTIKALAPASGSPWDFVSNDANLASA